MPITGTSRNAAGLAAAALFVLVSADAVHRYRDAWYLDLWSYPAHQVVPSRPAEQRGWTLPLLQLLRALPESEEILMPRLGTPQRLPGGLLRFLGTAQGESALRQRVRVVERATDARWVLAISCTRATPFTWIGFDSPEHRQRFDALSMDFDNQNGSLVHCSRKRLRTRHRSHARREHKFSLERIAVKILLRRCGKGFIGPLKYALGSNINPTSSGHLTIHYEPQSIVM